MTDLGRAGARPIPSKGDETGGSPQAPLLPTIRPSPAGRVRLAIDAAVHGPRPTRRRPLPHAGSRLIRFEIRPNPQGCTFVLTDAFDELCKAARDSAGWHACLDYLQHHLDGTIPPWESGSRAGYVHEYARERWNEVHAGYVGKFGQAASAIGPPV